MASTLSARFTFDEGLQNNELEDLSDDFFASLGDDGIDMNLVGFPCESEIITAPSTHLSFECPENHRPAMPGWVDHTTPPTTDPDHSCIFLPGSLCNTFQPNYGTAQCGVPAIPAMSTDLDTPVGASLVPKYTRDITNGKGALGPVPGAAWSYHNPGDQ